MFSLSAKEEIRAMIVKCGGLQAIIKLLTVNVIIYTTQHNTTQHNTIQHNNIVIIDQTFRC